MEHNSVSRVFSFVPRQAVMWPGPLYHQAESVSSSSQGLALWVCVPQQVSHGLGTEPWREPRACPLPCEQPSFPKDVYQMSVFQRNRFELLPNISCRGVLGSQLRQISGLLREGHPESCWAGMGVESGLLKRRWTQFHVRGSVAGAGAWDVRAHTQDPILLRVGFEQKPASPLRRELSLLSASQFYLLPGPGPFGECH